MREKIAKIAGEIARIQGKLREKLRGKNREKIAKIAYSNISVIIDGTSPKLSWQIGLTMPYKHTKFQVKSRQGAGLVSKRNTNREKNRKKNRKKSQGKLRKIAERCAKNGEKIAGKNCQKIAEKS